MDDNEQQQDSAFTLSEDPYAILKLDRDATNAMIQSSYKTLSRTFHPDKHPPGADRDAAQQVFVKFKNAHDLLMDPVLRQVYDYYSDFRDDHHDSYEGGVDKKSSSTYANRSRRCNEAIRIVRMTMYATNPNALYPTLLRFHMQGQSHLAEEYFVQALQQTRIEKEDSSLRVGATLDFPCSIQSTALSGEGTGPLDIPEQSDASISVSTSAAFSASSKWDMTVGLRSVVEKGIGHKFGNVQVGYRPHQGTQIQSTIDFLHPMRFALSTTRTMTNRTVVTTTVRTISPSTKTLALSIVSHRDLWQSFFRASWALGVGSDLLMHFGYFSLTTLSSEYPTCSARINLGADQNPLKLSVKQDFGEDGAKRTGYLSIAMGTKGVEYRATLSRLLTSNATLSMGIRHATLSGLTWLFQVERGNFTFRLPISICTITNPSYRFSLVQSILWTLALDDFVGDVIHNSMQSVVSSHTTNKQNSKVKTDTNAKMRLTKKQSDAETQISLMKPTAERNMDREKQLNGLYIYQAQYFIDSALGEKGPSVAVDVTIQLQFWVQNSKLYIPAGSKSTLLGFYPIVEPAKQQQRHGGGITSWLRRWISFSEGSTHDALTYAKSTTIPRLRVRYTFGNETFETTVNDTDVLILPDPKATSMGSSNVVR